MSSVSERTPAAAATRPPPWRDVRVLRVVFQAVFALLVVALLWYLFDNLTTNMRRAGLSTNFNYLGQPTGVDIRDSDFRPSQAIRDATLVGLLNTVRVSVVGILLASLLGLVVGLARLSTNWLVRRLAAAYVETFRNIPVLVIILTVYLAVVLRFPPISRPLEILELVVFSNRGLVVPWGETDDGGLTGVALLLGVALALGWVVARWRTALNDRTGTPHRRVRWFTAVVAAVLVIGYIILDAPVVLSLPELDGRVVRGGISLGPEYSALLAGLVIYTTTHIAEIVRGSILAVPRGQTEAATALALSGPQRIRYVVLPQALRIMVPPLANQYLNLTKNSSLAVGVGYFELTRISQQVIANGNPAPQVIAVLMACYLFLSLAISLIANIVNRGLMARGAR